MKFSSKSDLSWNELLLFVISISKHEPDAANLLEHESLQ